MNWVLQNRAKGFRGREVVTESAYRIGTGWTTCRGVLQNSKNNTPLTGRNQSICIKNKQTKNIILRCSQVHTYRPSTEQINQEVATKACRQHLGDNIQVGYQGRLQDDGDVGGVEELDGVGVVLATVAR